ncbi:hypothetical protein SacmaDRAFT_5188 [Saccharomonospora marina XMU15]|uniref:Uncharacterized protein n=1 Tax=Saccharomonospora marina XMU15 TaxID=882083 RepID=H5X521_9PSEU|nr:hypothetical protein [Saccharomonospora marina]EHR53353.1 hypothetical protein SacmaDRAFT_5188 [Saccharomonospora marina XMU15]
MAKQTFPGLQTSTNPLKKVIGTVVVLALLVVVAKYPADAASWVKTLLSWLDGVVTFLRQVGG